ncbi:YbjN domain-containing protein [Pannus brasiliensis CCIBt3594]|uniref:YbjN domain-containing protein n=1 Tax=Pannus brasiliensis CCIBt3594 TaxID=1427578 RepID=A0AAW9QS22_9CHRO
MTAESLSTTEEVLETMTDEFIANTSTHKEMIETVISSLQQNDSAMVQESGDGYLWKFEYGSVEVFVQLTGESDDDFLSVWSFVLKLPVKDELGLMRKVLEMNCSETFEAHFGIMEDRLVVISQRTVADLAPGEISRSITLVATVADNNDEYLKETFGGT